MKAYKRFEPGLICKGYKYPEGEWVEFPEAKLCQAGAHSCLNPLDTNKYYAPAHSEIREVEIEDVSDEHGDDSKVVSKRIKVGASLDVAGICKAHFEYVKEHCTENKECGNYSSVSGGYSSSVSGGNGSSVSGGDRSSVSGGYGSSVSGGNGSSVSGGDRSSVSGGNGSSVSGGYGSSVSGGNYSSVSGGYSSSVSGGNGSSVSGGYGSSVSGGNDSSVSGGYGSSVSGGNGSSVSGGNGSSVSGGYGSSVVSRGKSATGENGIACARGNGCRVKGGMGAVLVIAEENEDDCDIAAWRAVVVDGKNIKPDTWYQIKDGELVVAEDD